MRIKRNIDIFQLKWFAILCALALCFHVRVGCFDVYSSFSISLVYFDKIVCLFACLLTCFSRLVFEIYLSVSVFITFTTFWIWNDSKLVFSHFFVVGLPFESIRSLSLSPDSAIQRTNYNVLLCFRVPLNLILICSFECCLHRINRCLLK